MKALTLFASLPMLLAVAAPALAEESSCPNCIAHERKIKLLEAQLDTLKAQTTAPSPASSIPDASESTAPAVESSGKTYTVAAGDSFLRIARKHGCTAAALAAVNGMTLESVIHPGQSLKLPVGSSTSAAAPAPAQPKKYTIKEGDTYYNISRRLKIPLDELMAANPKAKATELYNGRVINLPSTGTADTPATSTPESSPDTPTESVETPTDEPSTPSPAKKIQSVKIQGEITYDDFAAKHGTTTQRLNELNGLDLAGTTVLAIGSELYVPNPSAGE